MTITGTCDGFGTGLSIPNSDMDVGGGADTTFGLRSSTNGYIVIGNSTASGPGGWSMRINTATGDIGTGAMPTARLEVAGQVKITGGSPGAGKVLTSDAAGLGSWQTPASSGVPSGAVMFFNLASCPAGWTELTAGRGRYIVGLPASGTLAGTAGTALTNTENRVAGQHTHGITGNWGNWYSCPNRPSGVNYCYSTNGLSTDGISGGAVAGTNAPYIQLLVCQKT